MSIALLDCPEDGLIPIHSPNVSSPESNGGIQITMSVPCPLCKRQVTSIPAMMHPDGSVEIELTHQQIAELREAQRWAQRVTEDGSVHPVEVVSRLLNTFRKISPVLPGVLVAMASKKGLAAAAWISVLLAAAGFMVQVASSNDDEPAKFSVEEIERLAEVLERSRDGEPTRQAPAFPMPQVEPPRPGATEHP